MLGNRKKIAPRMYRSFSGYVLALLLAFASHALGQFDVRPRLSPNVAVEEVDQATLAQLERANKFFTEKQFSDALETLRRAIDSQGERLIATTVSASPEGFITYAPLRDEGQRRLCSMAAAAPEILRHYRAQADAEAKSLLERATKERDEALLARIATQYLASSWGDDAALLAGDAALARGDFVAARRAWLKLHTSFCTGNESAERLGVYPGLPWYWAFRGTTPQLTGEELRQLLSSPAMVPLLPAAPDSNVPQASVRARLLLASILEGDLPRAEWELAQFKLLHVGAKGPLAGRNGVYAETLEQMLRQSREWPPPKPEGDWPTFAGAANRNGHGATQVDIAGQALWSIELPRIKSDRDLIGAGRLRVAEHHDGILCYHPIVVENLVIVADAQSLRAYELKSGNLAWEVRLREEPELEVLTNQQVGVPRFTLTATEGVVIATLPAAVAPVRRAPTVRREAFSQIVAVDLKTRKRVFQIVADDATMVFEGTPLLDRGRVYVALRKQAEIQPQLFVACYDLATGRPLWQQPIASASSLGEGKQAEFANSLLTLSHDTLYINSNLGVVAALATNNGVLRWLTRYPRASFPAEKAERSDRHFFRDLNPCVLHQGQVFCAPTDCERIFSLDAVSGQLIWSLPPNAAADAIHLLGATENYLLASGDYLYWIDTVQGQVVTQFPQALPTGPGLALPTPRGWGRGTLAAGLVLWPTQTTLHLFSTIPLADRSVPAPLSLGAQKVGESDLHLRGTSGGNVIVSNGYLILTTADSLRVFSQ